MCRNKWFNNESNNALLLTNVNKIRQFFQVGTNINFINNVSHYMFRFTATLNQVYCKYLAF